MYRAEISLVIFKILGIWPSKESKKIYLTIYNVYSIFVISILLAFTISSNFYTLTRNLETNEFIEFFFISTAAFSTCIKMLVIYRKHSRIREIRNYLNTKQYEYRDSIEFSIQSKFDKIGRFGTIFYASATLLTTTTKALTPIVLGLRTSTFFNPWVPYKFENRILFWLTFFYQSLGGIIGGQAGVAGDTFIMTMMLQICAQVEILIHRMQIFPEMCKKKFPNNPKMEQIILNEWIQHHNSLYRLKDELNEVYNYIFFIQFILTTLSVCMLTIQLTTINVLSTKFLSTIMILFCVIMQICILCWSGDLVIEKSKSIGSAIFITDWLSLTKRTKSSLIHIMQRSNIPIRFTAGSLVPISIDTFGSILRLAYSIYNCLSKG